MGIKDLNKFLQEHANEHIKKIHFNQMYGKKIAVDISIFMYKYAATGSLIENIYLMLSIFRYYHIIPIFIFDGKSPNEKKNLLMQRKEERKNAENEYNNLQMKLDSNFNMEELEKQEIINNMNSLKKKFVHICKKDIEIVKKLIQCYGATYYDAPYEADQICALLTIKGKVWACLSEDTDMFVYGCPRVIRYFSLLNHNAIIYETKEILKTLDISQIDLREICVLSGTDYNINDKNDYHSFNLYSSFKYFKKYKKSKCEKQFYDWLLENMNYKIDNELLIKICNLFDLNMLNHINIKLFDNIKITNGQIFKKEMKEILTLDGFVFN
jgi:5'-3' exonuclease